jgi:hypothetical protein
LQQAAFADGLGGERIKVRTANRKHLLPQQDFVARPQLAELDVDDRQIDRVEARTRFVLHDGVDGRVRVPENSASRLASHIEEKGVLAETVNRTGAPFIAAQASCKDAKAGPAAASRRSPAAVTPTPPRPVLRSSSLVPIAASRPRIWWLTALVEMFRSVAARAKPPRRATASNAKRAGKGGMSRIAVS